MRFLAQAVKTVLAVPIEPDQAGIKVEEKTHADAPPRALLAPTHRAFRHWAGVAGGSSNTTSLPVVSALMIALKECVDF
jgi:hypothetical protein